MADEARAMLDALMGNERNDPLPSGAAVKRSRGGEVILPSKRKKSCYDADICPLYCAWNGTDVYELFVNTKSDIGPNPKQVSDSALDEYQQLPPHEQERLGFEYLLFQKLQDLVRMCDRTVSRNKEKLIQEKRGKGTANIDYVTMVDERAIEEVCRTQIDLNKVLAELQSKEEELEQVMKREAELQEQYEKEQREKEAAGNVGVVKEDSKEDAGGDEAKVEESTEESKDNGAKEGEKANGVAPDESSTANKGEDETEDPKKNEDEEQANVDVDATTVKDSEETPKQEEQEESELEKEMRALLLKRQRLLFDIARTLQQYAPIKQAKEAQMEQLNYLKSDITSDKTVCEVSGNFMSARDADERIAAHYAGKQYVGWKLVRDKFKDMIQKYGRYGPPPGEARRGPSGGGGRGGDRYGRDGGRWDRGGGGGGSYNRGGHDRGGGYNRGYGGGGDHYRRGGGGRDRGRWRR